MKSIIRKANKNDYDTIVNDEKTLYLNKTILEGILLPKALYIAPEKLFNYYDFEHYVCSPEHTNGICFHLYGNYDNLEKDFGCIELGQNDYIKGLSQKQIDIIFSNLIVVDLDFEDNNSNIDEILISKNIEFNYFPIYEDTQLNHYILFRYNKDFFVVLNKCITNPNEKEFKILELGE